MHSLNCAICHAPFTSRTVKALYCSPLCRSRAFNAARKADGRLKAQREQLSEYRAKWMRDNAERYRETRICRCGAEFRCLKYSAQVGCSNTCFAAMRRGYSRLPMSHPVRVLIRKSRGAQVKPPRLFVMGGCRRCGNPFTAEWQNPTPECQPAYCSRKCGDSDMKDRRNARKRGAYVAPVYRAQIFARDKWVCQLCGRKVKRGAVAPHPLAPSLDHILPISKGGTHEPANAQLAHFGCNSLKGDRTFNGGAEQLSLAG